MLGLFLLKKTLKGRATPPTLRRKTPRDKEMK